jgi:uncharacterized membrane protein (DUF373 family)
MTEHSLSPSSDDGRRRVTSGTLGTATIDDDLLVDTTPIPLESPTGSAPHIPPAVARRLGFRTAHLGVVGIAEDVIHYGVALVLMVVAAIVLYRTTYDLVGTSEPFAQAATTAVNGVLFAIIIMEVMRTVMAHFDRGGLQLQPFLIIGIISAVREILSVGAHLSLSSSGHDGGASTTHLALLELGVNAGVVVGLAAALVLVRRLAGMRDDTSVERLHET